MHNIPSFRLSLAAYAAFLTLGIQSAAAVHNDECAGFSAAEIPRYEVVCAEEAESAADCMVDARTSRGFEIYIVNCATCHGHGTGTSTSPAADLTRRRIEYEGLHLTLFHGHDENLAVMPGWKGNCDVIPSIDELYLYLKARSDGVLPPGRPSGN